MKITVKAALEMAQAVGALDGYQNGGPALTPYKYDGATRLAIAAARRKLRTIAEDYAAARNALLLEVSKGTGELPQINSAMAPEQRHSVIALHVEFDRRDKELQAAEVELDIAQLPAEKLNLDDNPIPPTVLDMLGEFIAL